MKKTLIILILSCFAFQAMAWDAFGHRVVAELAYKHLTKKARKQVDAVLGTRGIVYCASWPDEIKSDTIYPDSHVWHYQNLKSGMTHEDLDALYNNKTLEGKHIFYALDSLTNVLRVDKTDEVALKFVVHFMGDMYCPMHMAHPDDIGGNKVEVRWFGQKTNLHSVWDRWMAESLQMSVTEVVTMIDEKYASEKKRIEQTSELELIYTTYDRVEAIYKWHEGGDKSPYHYTYRFRNDLEMSYYTAGIKLAQLLNELYK